MGSAPWALGAVGRPGHRARQHRRVLRRRPHFSWTALFFAQPSVGLRDSGIGAWIGALQSGWVTLRPASDEADGGLQKNSAVPRSSGTQRSSAASCCAAASARPPSRRAGVAWWGHGVAGNAWLKDRLA